MTRSTGFLLSLSVALTLYGGIHYYFWTRLIRAPALPSAWQTSLSVLLFALALSVPAALVAARLLGWSVGNGLMWPAFAWTGFALFLLLTLISIDLVRWLSLLVASLSKAETLRDPSRRLMLSRLAAGGAALVSAGLAAYAIRSAVSGPSLRKLKVTLPRWPSALDGFKIVQLTDVHVGRTIGRSYVEDVVQKANAVEADLIVITGDLVDGSPDSIGDAVEPIAELKARHGVYFVTGNHDYYSGVEPWVAWLRKRDIQVLRNQRVSLGEEGAQFDLAGVDDSYFNANVTAALRDRDPSREVILLAHQPQEIATARQHGVGLQLSGHTHGGQIWPFTWFAGRLFHFVAGLYKVGESQLYVSRGTGYVGPPMRLGAPSEITLLEVHGGERTAQSLS